MGYAAEYVCFALFGALFSLKVTGEPISMTCPSTFIDDAANRISCAVDTAAIASANCFATPTSVTFKLSFEDGTPDTPCSTSYTVTDCDASKVTANNTCGCTSLSGDVKTFTLLLVANKTKLEGAKLECEVCGASPAVGVELGNCAALSFSVSDGGSDGLSGGAIAGIVIGSLAGVALIGGIAYCAVKKK